MAMLPLTMVQLELWSLLPRSKKKLKDEWWMTPPPSYPTTTTSTPSLVRSALELARGSMPHWPEEAVIFDPSSFRWVPRWFRFQIDCLSLEASLAPPPGAEKPAILHMNRALWTLVFITEKKRPKSTSSVHRGRPLKLGWPPSEQCQMPAV